MSTPSQRKKLPVNPSLEHLQKQAKRRVKQEPSLQLAAAQHQIALEYGCENWAQLAQVVKTMSRRNDIPVTGKERYEPMPKMARARDLEGVLGILREGSFTQHDLDQSLAHALYYGNGANWTARKAIADVLLDHGADPDGQYGSGGAGPIVLGTGECIQVAGLQYLIDAGADVAFAPVQTKYGLTCPLSSILGTYARGSNDDKHRYIDLLLKHGAYVPPNVTPPILAIHRGDVGQLGELIDRDPGLLAQRFPHMPYGNMLLRGAALLHCAVEFGENECIEELLRRGANINLRADIIGGIGGQTPIFHAIATNLFAGLPTLEYLARRAGPAIDMTVRATWSRFGVRQSEPMTPLEFAEHAAQTGEAKWQAKAAEEMTLLRSIA
ncbi:MAG TPA: hypothetical protein VG838_08360 [Opitutaceae bacterium]|nr:hypothetical protein [Opitutaceae bacterium]